MEERDPCLKFKVVYYDKSEVTPVSCMYPNANMTSNS